MPLTPAIATRSAPDELKAGQALMADIHARDLAMAQHDAQAGQQAAAKAGQGEGGARARRRDQRAAGSGPGGTGRAADADRCRPASVAAVIRTKKGATAVPAWNP